MLTNLLHLQILQDLNLFDLVYLKQKLKLNLIFLLISLKKISRFQKKKMQYMHQEYHKKRE